MKEFIEKLIGRLEENTIYDKQAIGFMNKYGRNIGFISKRKAIEIVNQLAEEMGVSKLENTTWIPCSERLPDIENKTYLITRLLNETPIVLVATYANKEWHNTFYYEIAFRNVIAWQPLPAPYQKGE